MRRFHLLSFLCLIAFLATASITAYADDTGVAADTGAIAVSRGTIMLDPGHGGSDSGALGLYGLIEKHLTLDIADRVSELLQAAGYSVLLTRTDDSTVQLSERSDMANASDIKLFASIHINAAPNPNGNGIEVFYRGGDNESVLLAKEMQKELVSRLGATDRGVKDGSKLWVIRKTKAPAVLIENLFLSNQQDAAKLFDESVHQTIAQAISDGILRYLEPTPVLPVPGLPAEVTLPVPMVLPASPIPSPVPVVGLP